MTEAQSRYTANLQGEIDSAALYRTMASAEKNPQLAEVYSRLAAVEDAHAERIGLECHAGHGLSYDTVGPVAAIAAVAELNIGHFLVGEAIFVGLDGAIRRMRALMDEARA